MKPTAFVCACILATAFGAAAQIDAPEKRFELSAQASVNYGPADGFMQIPAGGNPGSSTAGRPSFHDLKIDDALFYDTRLDVRWCHLDVFGGYQAMDFDSSGTLARPLVSRSINFGSGTPFSTSDSFDWFRVGVGWKFELLDRKLEIMPKIDVAVLDFSYRLSSPSAEVSRSFTKGAGRLGLEAVYRFTPRLALKVDGAASIPVSNTPQIATVTATANFDLLSHPAPVRPSVFLGLGFQRIDYEDNQPLPNHIRVDTGPFVTAGVAVSF